jgi:hypothetical protein
LLRGLPGPLGNGEILVWVNPGDVDSVQQEVLELIQGTAGPLERRGPGGAADRLPADAADLMTKLPEVDEAMAAQVLVWLMSTTMAYGGSGRYEQAKARDIISALTRLLGHGTRWRTNVDSWTFAPARSWNPVTRHTMDAVVVAAGGGVIVTFLAVDED